MPIADLADALAKQGIDVRSVLTQTTSRPGQPDVVTDIGLDLGDGLCLYQFADGGVVLHSWRAEDEWVEIGEFDSEQVSDLAQAIKEESRS
jgi:hypothetical protein